MAEPEAAEPAAEPPAAAVAPAGQEVKEEDAATVNGKGEPYDLDDDFDMIGGTGLGCSPDAKAAASPFCRDVGKARKPLPKKMDGQWPQPSAQ